MEAAAGRLMFESAKFALDRSFRMNGADVRKLMRMNHVTIKQLAERMQISQAEVRDTLRMTQPMSGHRAIMWHEMITGSLTPRMRAALRSWRREADEQLEFECQQIRRGAIRLDHLGAAHIVTTKLYRSQGT